MEEKVRKVLILPDIDKQEARDLSLEVEAWLEDFLVVSCKQYDFDESDKPEFAVLLGGDGFIMRKSLYLAREDILFIAINCGTTGFLAVAERNDWQDWLGKVLQENYVVDKRPVMLVDEIDGGKTYHSFEVAGNVYIRHMADMILFSVNIDGKPVYENLRGDGVIVANATGATAYNLAADGALISSGLVVTPICPHALNVKSLPVPESAKMIEIIYHGRKSSYGIDEGCLLHLDSERHLILPGTRLEIRKSGQYTSFITPEGFSFIESLQKKLGLSR